MHLFKLKRVWRVCLQTGDWVKLWNASDMSCVLYVLFSVFTEEEILIFKLFQMSAGSAQNNLQSQSHQELRVTGKPPGSWKTRKLFHLRTESCGRAWSWGVERSSGMWILGVLPLYGYCPWQGWALTSLATQTIDDSTSSMQTCSFQTCHLLMLDPRLWGNSQGWPILLVKFSKNCRQDGELPLEVSLALGKAPACGSIFGKAAGGVLPVQNAAVIVSHGSGQTGNFCVP